MCNDDLRYTGISCTPKPQPMKDITESLEDLARIVISKQRRALSEDRGPEDVARKIMALSEVKAVLRKAKAEIEEIGRNHSHVFP